MTLTLRLAAFVSLFVLLPVNASGPTPDEACKQAWENSSASSSCGSGLYPCGTNTCVNTNSYHVTANANDQCVVSVSCSRTDPSQSPSQTSFTGSDTQVTGLVNCDGTLKENSC